MLFLRTAEPPLNATVAMLDISISRAHMHVKHVMQHAKHAAQAHQAAVFHAMLAMS